MSDLKPSMSDVRISLDLLARYGRAGHLSDAAYRALTSIVAHVAGDICWTYTPPGDGSLADDDEFLSKLAMSTTMRSWLKIKPEVMQFFVLKGGRWHLTEDWIEIDDRPSRFAVPSQIAAAVVAREGRRCTYCGSTAGPFDLDHIFPVSKGGLNDASNLTLACANCNRSKGAKTLREWLGR